MLNAILGGRYELLEEIGKGGMAYVYKARCVLLDRIVAVKILRDDLDGGEEFLRRFNQEAQAAASLAHPNIVSIFDVGVDSGRHYIVMEYVDGITLKEYITKNKKIPYEEALDITYQIADALSAAHDKKIVHRDIKPHNILITPDKNIKVTDFGIARFGTGNTLSKGDDILGSVHYISPEQAKGEKVDNRSDLYSLGISLYEMINGKVPFDADTPVAVAMMQIKDEAKPILLDGNDVLPIGVQQIVLKSISKEADKRYQTALEFKNDILNILKNPNFKLFESSDCCKGDINETVTNETITQKSSHYVTTWKKIFLTALSFVTALTFVLGFYFVTNRDFTLSIKNLFSSQTIKAPLLEGKTLEEGKKICDELGFDLIVKEEEDDVNALPDTILSQNPPPETKTKNPGSIEVVINKSHNYLIDNYSGKNYKEAESILASKGYSVNVIFEESKKDEDLVLRQSPNPGSKLKENAVITLYVSAGLYKNENYVTVPTLVDLTYDKALSLISECELSLGTVSGTASSHSDDLVVSQAIPAGSLVIKQAEVGITIKCIHDNDSESSDNHNQDIKDTDTKSE